VDCVVFGTRVEGEQYARLVASHCGCWAELQRLG
jgi:hypothetical protein